MTEPFSGRPHPKPDARSVARVLHGIHPVMEALRVRGRVRAVWVERDSRNPQLKRLTGQARAAGVRVETCDWQRLQKLSQSTQHQGVVAEAVPLSNGSLSGLLKDRPDDDLTVLMIDRVQDPQNLGNIYRSAEAAGVALIFLPAKATASHQLGSVAKASAGAVEHVPTVVVSALRQPAQELRAAGFRILGLDMEASTGLWETDFGRRTALLVGAEGGGLGAAARGLCDGFVGIPMHGKVDSLNVTNAVAVVLYEVVRQRRGRAG